ncbi:conserved exported hypothetical protein [Nitrospira lenta]|uniref:DUF5666 domain-containing protein n=2 Tax=Nitrospira lenta TaxID=1436998 RepID=A0A330L469_9BACT|nr:conserved exported hypothetical protein [Nitrospira lenta]
MTRLPHPQNPVIIINIFDKELMPTMIQHLVLAFALVFASSAAWAHGSGQHVLGTVTVIDGTHIEVKTPKGKVVSVTLTTQTKFKAKGNPSSTEPPSVGDRVVIEATKDKKALTATEVHYSAAKKAAAAPQAPAVP